MKKWIIMELIVIFLIIGIIIFVYEKKVIDTEVYNTETKCEFKHETEESTFKVYHPALTLIGNEEEILVILLNDRRERWDEQLPLTNEFKEKYKNERVCYDNEIKKYFYNGTLFDNLATGLPELEEGINRIYAEGDKGIYACSYKIIADDNYKIKDIEYINKILVENPNDEKTREALIKFDKDNYIELFEIILFPTVYKMQLGEFAENISRKNVALTDNFIKKYGYDEDIIKYDTPLKMHSFSIKEDGSDFENRDLSFAIKLPYKNKYIDYKCKFILDKNNYLYDISIVESIERKISDEMYKYDWDIINIVIIKNSNWELCPLSSKFLNKYNNSTGIIDSDLKIERLERIDIDRKKVRIKEHFGLLNVVFEGEIRKPYLFKVIWNNNNEVDDILTYMIPEDKSDLTYEEMYKLAFND